MFDQLIAALQTHSWWPAIALASTLFVAAFRVVAPSYWDRIPTRWKPVPAGALVLALAIVEAAASGATWTESCYLVPVRVLECWPMAVGIADALLRMTGEKQPSLDSIKKSVAVSVVLFVGGCSWFSSNHEAVANGASAVGDSAEEACSSLPARDRESCELAIRLAAATAQLAAQLAADMASLQVEREPTQPSAEHRNAAPEPACPVVPDGGVP